MWPILASRCDGAKVRRRNCKNPVRIEDQSVGSFFLIIGQPERSAALARGNDRHLLSSYDPCYQGECAPARAAHIALP